MFAILVPILLEKGVVNIIGSYCGPYPGDVVRIRNQVQDEMIDWTDWVQVHTKIYRCEEADDKDGPAFVFRYRGITLDDGYTMRQDEIIGFDQYFWKHFLKGQWKKEKRRRVKLIRAHASPEELKLLNQSRWIKWPILS